MAFVIFFYIYINTHYVIPFYRMEELPEVKNSEIMNVNEVPLSQNFIIEKISQKNLENVYNNTVKNDIEQIDSQKEICHNNKNQEKPIFNPWSVDNIDYFLYYNCPECDERNKNRELFLKHALDEHPLAKECLGKAI